MIINIISVKTICNSHRNLPGLVLNLKKRTVLKLSPASTLQINYLYSVFNKQSENIGIYR